MSRRFAHGLVIGKFYPPHAGHHFLVDSAAAACDRVTVVIGVHPDENLPVEQREAWLAAAHAHQPNVRVIAEVDPNPVDFDSPAVWTAHVRVFAAAVARAVFADGLRPACARVDAVFSSEPYGIELARRFGATPVAVDPARAALPVSATQIRSDVAAHWDYLAPSTRAGLAVRVVVIGAESSGTTTLAGDLAAALRERGGAWERTACVPEHGREHTLLKVAALDAQGLLDRPAAVSDLCWTAGDFVDIAVRQNALEDEAAPGGGPVLVCDTDTFATGTWYERYLGGRHPGVDALARQHPLYLLTDHEGVAFTPDSVRDGDGLRAWMTGRLAELLDETGRHWRRLKGDRAERLAGAVAAVDEVCAGAWAFARRGN